MSFTNGTAMKTVKNLVGQEFNRLVVVEYLGVGKHRKHYWRCVCDCGNQIRLPTSSLTSNTPTKSCGCLRKETLKVNRAEPTKHGLHKHKLYAVYRQMRQRCENPKSQRWKYYGGKGVKVEWENFQSFYDWAYSCGYQEGLSIDRVDNDKNYCPENCRWITISENTRHAHVGRTKKPAGA